MQSIRSIACLSLALLLTSCPGDEQTDTTPSAGGSPDLTQTELSPEDKAAVEAALDDVAGEIDAAANSAAAEIDESNAAEALEQLTKELSNDN